MWKPGTPITIVSTNVRQVLSSTVGLVKAIRFMQHWGNSNRIFLGDVTLDPTATPPLGIDVWLPAPAAGLISFADVREEDAPNGINTEQLYVTGTATEVILWSYLEQ